MIIAFLIGGIIGAIATFVIEEIFDYRYEWRSGVCARCERPRRDWGPPEA